MDKVIATDLDGTLLYPKRRLRMLPSDTRKFLTRFHDEGGRLVIVSGRNRSFGRKLQRNIGFPIDQIGCNGSFVSYDDKMIYENWFDPKEIIKVIEYMRSTYDIPLMIVFTKDHNMVLNTKGVSTITNIGYVLYQFYQGRLREPFIRSEHLFWKEIETGKVYKLMMMFGLTKKKIALAAKACEHLNEHFADTAVFAWSGEFLEITPKGCSKSSGLSFYLDHCGVSKDNVLVVGDSGNDISMFDAFKSQSFCMDHGPEDVKKHASHTLKRFADLEAYVYPSEETQQVSDKE